MKKLTFFYAVMNAGKSLKLLQDEHNHRNVNKRVLTLKPSLDTRNEDKIETRLGNLSIPAISFQPEDSIINTLLNYESDLKTIDVIFIDEVQFSTVKQIEELRYLVSKYNIEIYAYGLRTNFKTEMFEGSKRLFELADKLIEISTLCDCGRKATMNMRIDETGKKVTKGKELDCGKEDKYLSVCYDCYQKS